MGLGVVSAVYIGLQMVKASQRWLDFPFPHIASQWELACGLPLTGWGQWLERHGVEEYQHFVLQGKEHQHLLTEAPDEQITVKKKCHPKALSRALRCMMEGGHTHDFSDCLLLHLRSVGTVF